MANLNKVILIGRLTRDPESRTFANGGKVTKFGFAVTNRKKNTQTGQWEDEPMFIDCEAFNRGETGTLANIIEQYCRKGSQICIEGRLRLDQWDDKTTGQKRSKHMIIVEAMQLLDPKQDGQGGGGPRSTAAASSSAPSRSSGGGEHDHDSEFSQPDSGGEGDKIPF
jgi:single-strand DNA-binding protein